MLVELPPAARETLRPLLSALPGLHGCLDAALEGAMGSAWADPSPEGRPAVAALQLDFYIFGGDAAAPAAEEAVRGLPGRASIVTSGDGWAPLLRRVWGGLLHEHTRVAFRPGVWDRVRLRGFIDALPQGFALKRIAMADAARFAGLAGSLVYNYPSLEEFVARGVGFGVEHDGRFVSGCSSFAMSSHRLEFEIQTHPDFRRRGLACATAAAMIEHCVERGLEPCWDAHNDISAALATKLGFVDPAPYTAYELRA